MSIPPSFQATPATSSHLTKVILDKQVVLDFTAGWGISCNMVPHLSCLLLGPHTGGIVQWERHCGLGRNLARAGTARSCFQLEQCPGWALQAP